MRAILINPQDQTVSEVDYNGDFHHIYQLIGANCFDCVRIGDRRGHTIYVDDNGLLDDTASRVGMFRYDGDNPAYLAGKGLILASDNRGGSAPATMTLDEVREKVAFGGPARTPRGLEFIEIRKLELPGGLMAGEITGRSWPIDN